LSCSSSVNEASLLGYGFPYKQRLKVESASSKPLLCCYLRVESVSAAVCQEDGGTSDKAFQMVVSL